MSPSFGTGPDLYTGSKSSRNSLNELRSMIDLRTNRTESVLFHSPKYTVLACGKKVESKHHSVPRVHPSCVAKTKDPLPCWKPSRQGCKGQDLPQMRERSSEEMSILPNSNYPTYRQAIHSRPRPIMTTYSSRSRLLYNNLYLIYNNAQDRSLTSSVTGLQAHPTIHSHQHGRCQRQTPPYP